jgi:eukaryotic-like serine/threonine-protein kinase
VEILDPIVLSPDVILLPVADLPEGVRRRLDPEEGDWAITHPRSRTPSKLIDARAVELLEEFKSPRTIVDAVIRYSRAQGLDPEETLVEAYPLLERLLSAGFLVREGSEEASGIAATLQPGDRIAGFEVLECVQSLEDAEVYQVRKSEVREGTVIAALKIEREGRAQDLLKREARVLAHLDGGPAPRLLGEGEVDGRRWLALEWFPGVDAATAAAELRAGDGEGLRALCLGVLGAYARLHECGVVHGDVHPRNILVGRGGEVRLVDFGFARWSGEPTSLAIAGGGRGGVGFFFEPEYAAAVLAGEPPPAASPAGEQHAVAALLYLLIAGAHTHDFKLAREAMLRQIAGEPPLPLAERGAEPGPGVEEVLAKALAKAPGERFASIAELTAAFGSSGPPPARRRPAGRSAAEALLARFLDRLGMAGDLFREGLPEPPRASVTYGAAGLACGLYRIAAAREDAEILSLADLWAAKAARETGDEAFYKPGSRIEPGNVGRISAYHTATGVHAVRAMIAHALGDAGSRREAVDAFVAAAGAPCANPDLTLGRSGVLLAAALLTEPMGDPPAGLTELGDWLLADLWEEIGELPTVPECGGVPNLGMAHGWAGYLYALLRWCRATGRPLPERLPERLAELASCARPWGRGLRWRWYAEDGRDAGSMPGWCNGSAGFVFLWTLAWRMLGDDRYRSLAEGAAWNAWESPDSSGNLCCGLAGRAYALLNLHRHGGGPEWLERARILTERAAVAVDREGGGTPGSLYKGAAGVAVLAADLARPEGAAFPFFEEEGWT